MESKTAAEVWPVKGRNSSGHLVEHYAQGEQIAARVNLLAQSLFRRHIGHGIESGPGGGEIAAACGCGRAQRSRRIELGEAEVKQLACPRLVTKMFPGLMSR